jgi:AcrR family transcriptional regulator
MADSPPQSRPRRPNIRGEQTRAALLEAALRSFAERGFHGTSTRDIAQAASMSPAALYAHYGTKEELLFELSLDGHCSVQRAVEDEVARCTNPASRLWAASASFGRWHAEFHTQARVVQYELSSLSPDHLRDVVALRRSTQDFFSDLVAHGVEEHVFHVDDAEMTALSLTSLGIDVARWYRPDGSWTPARIGQHHGDLALRAVQAAPLSS